MAGKGKKEEANSTEKANRLSKGRNSFRFGKKRTIGPRSAGISGKAVQVKGLSIVEELERKQSEIFRLLDCSEDAVEKNIPAYLVGFPSMILENVIALTRELEHLNCTANSSEFSSLMSRMNQTVAEHAIWIDRFYMHGNASLNDQSIREIVQNLRQAVKDVIDFAISKESKNGSDSNFFRPVKANHNESCSSIGSQDSPYSRKKHENRKNHTHGSMPEIPGATTGPGAFRVTNPSGVSFSRTSPSPPPPLTHSFSSDSILDNANANYTSTPNPSVYVVRDHEGYSSCDDSAPPVPPKRGIMRGRSSLRSSYNEYESPGMIMQSSSSFSGNTLDSSDCGSTPLMSNRMSGGSLKSASCHDQSRQLNCSSTSRSSTASQDSVHLLRPSEGRVSEASSSYSISSLDLSPHSSDACGGFTQEVGLSTPYTSRGDSCQPSILSTHSPIVDTLRGNYHSNIYETRGRILSDSAKESPSSYNASNASVSSQHHLVSHFRSARNSACSSSSRSSGSEIESNTVAMSVPPPIPKKTRQYFGSSSGPERGVPSNATYDNVDNFCSSSSASHVTFRHHSEFIQNSSVSYSASTSSSTHSSGLGSSKSSMASWESGSGSGSGSGSAVSAVLHRRFNESYQSAFPSRPLCDTDKPPLPLKQRHIMEYMQIFKDYQLPEKEWFQHRRSQQVVSSSYLLPPPSSVNTSDDFREDLEGGPTNANVSSRYRSSLPNPPAICSPPALPPKVKPRATDYSKHLKPTELTSSGNNSPASPGQNGHFTEFCLCQRKELPTTSVAIPTSSLLVNVVSRSNRANQSNSVTSPTSNNENENKQIINNEKLPSELPEEDLPSPDYVEEGGTVDVGSLMDSLNVDNLIIFQGDSEESDVKSGSVEALIVYATYSKNGSYLEAFLTTYRTFISPPELIAKLFYRYNKFVCRSSPEYQKATKNSFSLLVRVVHDLVVTELTETLLKDLSEFEYNLLSKGDLKLALYFRKKLSEKLRLRKTHLEQLDYSHYMSIKGSHGRTLLDFKSNDVADQMTLLDSELFSKFGIPEMLYYSREQNEEHCPNLAAFAMQINRMSSWVKTQILKSCPQDRERYYKKFIKIMKHLRKVNNNFNSCIAILSGLESADVRRLEWPKSSMDMLKEYCDLFDFEGSYRAYRQALAETKPPCIPHLGIILQDLTKLDNINPNFVDGKVNFLKRWLQFNILEDMKRFIPSKYDIRKNDAIRNFINNYEDCMSDSDLWDLSLTIKPKPKPK